MNSHILPKGAALLSVSRLLPCGSAGRPRVVRASNFQREMEMGWPLDEEDGQGD